MKIKSVAVLGAGAVGSYVIWGLSEKKDIRLGVIASGERAKRLKNKGCKINDTVYHPEVWTPEEAHGVDFLIVSLKYGALPGALDDITAVTGENTVIMSLMNGVDSEEIIAEKAGAEHLLHAVIKVASQKRMTATFSTLRRRSASFSAKFRRRTTVSVCRLFWICSPAQGCITGQPIVF